MRDNPPPDWNQRTGGCLDSYSKSDQISKPHPGLGLFKFLTLWSAQGMRVGRSGLLLQESFCPPRTPWFLNHHTLGELSRLLAYHQQH